MKTATCPFCEKKTTHFTMYRGNVVGCRLCGIHTKETNADRNRSMTDEELTEWLNYICDAYYMPDQGWLDWLKSEVKGSEG